jgi:hypothetical protein
MEQETYLTLFLDENDLPEMRRTQDSRLRGADPQDSAFLQYQGQYSGMAAWMADEQAAIGRLVDIRWVFPTDMDAAAYHQATLNVNCEGEPLVQNAPPVGLETYVFGGTTSDYSLFQITGTATSSTKFFYIFRAGRVVIKLYIAEGEMAGLSSTRLHVGMAQQIAERINWRVNAVLQNPQAMIKPPFWKKLFS